MKRNILLTPEIVEALKNDEHLKELHKRLGEIHSKAFPIVVQVSPTEFWSSYGDEFDKLIPKVHQEIDFRVEQILSSFNNGCLSSQ